jgi:hypothetical protein
VFVPIHVDIQLNAFCQVDYLLHRLDGLSQADIDALAAQ